jgi:hypothetical protein
MSKEVSSNPIEDEQKPKDLGLVKSGRVWKDGKKPLRIRSLGISKTSTWEKRQKDRLALKAFKEKAKELKEEKEQERKVCILFLISTDVMAGLFFFSPRQLTLFFFLEGH